MVLWYAAFGDVKLFKYKRPHEDAKNAFKYEYCYGKYHRNKQMAKILFLAPVAFKISYFSKLCNFQEEYPSTIRNTTFDLMAVLVKKNAAFRALSFFLFWLPLTSSRHPEWKECHISDDINISLSTQLKCEPIKRKTKPLKKDMKMPMCLEQEHHASIIGGMFHDNWNDHFVAKDYACLHQKGIHAQCIFLSKQLTKLRFENICCIEMLETNILRLFPPQKTLKLFYFFHTSSSLGLLRWRRRYVHMHEVATVKPVIEKL